MSASPTTRPRPDSSALDRQRRWRRWAPGPTAAALALLCLTLMLLDLRGGPTDLLRSAGAAVGGPLQAVSDAAFGPLRTGEFRRADAEQLQRQVAQLAESNRRLQLENDVLAEQVADNPQSSAAAKRAQEQAESAVAAQVVAADPALGVAAVTIDAGADDGVVIDSPVLVAGGLVGRVTATSPSTSSVLLVTDPGSSVAARVTDNSALVQGVGDRRSADLDYLDPLAEVQVGQTVTTMGSDDGWPYPAGIPVGTVSAVSGDLGDLDRSVTIEPAVGLSTLDHVIVLTRPTDAARPQDAS